MVCPSHAHDSPQDYINAHNAARKQIGVQNMMWDNTVAAYAQNYANSRIGDYNLVHSSGDYGENIAKDTGSFTGTATMNLWVAKKPYYYYCNNSCVGGQCVHYTQAALYRCARVKCTIGWWFVTCNYYPLDNYVGQHPC
ncbi:hypothetical protein F2P56_030602 [Juglans regia]|uniref:SCP domain-containing protein n=2 Tax=Juglans regia TaxID=51240 RepID=A0A833X8I2_JUGRE|nr:basic form of pathogenesis-related protein 1-like [Juglans regia]KAF5450235.1 hypothetical protein F2P56_030602 [Juglans regia]